MFSTICIYGLLTFRILIKRLILYFPELSRNLCFIKTRHLRDDKINREKSRMRLINAKFPCQFHESEPPKRARYIGLEAARPPN